MDTSLLNKGVDDVKAGLAGLSRDDLTALRAAEVGDKKRRGVLDAIDEALAATTENSGTGTTSTAAATEFDPSGAPHQVAQVDPAHPALDANPRAATTDLQNRIDLNDPRLEGHDAVEKNLADQA